MEQTKLTVKEEFKNLTKPYTAEYVMLPNGTIHRVPEGMSKYEFIKQLREDYYN